MTAAVRTVRACLITNPRSGRGRLDLTAALATLVANGWQTVVRQKRHGGEATTIAREAAESGCDVVVGCGGDGTINEIVNGLAGSDVAVGVIPGGTVNLWARELGVSPRASVAALQLVTAQRRRADLGQVEIDGRHRRYFLLMAGLGVDGAVIRRVSKPLKNRIGPLAVGLAGVQALAGFHAARVRITIDGACWQGAVAQIVAGNTRLYGGFASLTPAALIDDGRLDLCLLTPSGVVESARQAASLFLHGHPRQASAESYRGALIRVQSPTLLPLQIDGGKVSLKHLKVGNDGVVYTFSTRPAAVTVLTPPTYDGGLFETATGWPAWEGGERNSSAVQQHTAGGNGEVRHGEQKLWLHVTGVGVETLTGVRADNGRAVTVLLGAGVRFKRASGERCAAAPFLSSLREGDLLRVKGTFDEEDRLFARRVRLVAPPDA